MPIVYSQNGSVFASATGEVLVGNCVCTLIVPGVWCPCNEGDQPDYTAVVSSCDVSSTVVAKPDGNCWEFDPANARPQQAGDVLFTIGEIFEDCDDCCGERVIPGTWCDCNEGDPPDPSYSPVLEAPCVGVIVTKIGGSCWVFDCADERPFEMGDTYAFTEGSYESCEDCCDDPDPDPQPTCCTGNAGLCYPLPSPMAIVSSNVIHRQTIICDGGGTWADYTEMIPFAGVFNMLQAEPPVPCGNSETSALVIPNVPYDYNGFCVNPGTSNLPLGYGFDASQFNGSPPDTEWNVRVDTFGVGVNTAIPNVQIIGGSVVSPPAFVQIGRATSFGLSLSLNFTAPLGISVSGRCGPELTLQWNGSRTWDFGVYAITMQSIGTIVVRFSGYGQCIDTTRQIVRARSGCAGCGHDSRGGTL